MLPGNGNAGPRTCDVDSSPGCWDCRSFQAIIVQTGGWSSREDTASRTNLRVRRGFLLVLRGIEQKYFDCFDLTARRGNCLALFTS